MLFVVFFFKLPLDFFNFQYKFQSKLMNFFFDNLFISNKKATPVDAAFFIINNNLTSYCTTSFLVIFIPRAFILTKYNPGFK